jgi:hypothetical protein
MPLQDARATARASVGAADRTRHELFAHGAQIAAFLSHANPTAWPPRATTMMMDDHLNLTTTEAVDELNAVGPHRSRTTTKSKRRS